MRLLLLAVLALAALCVPALAERRVALVIGNSAYTHVSPLPNPINDANDIAAALGRIGFDVTLASDMDGDTMRATLRRFREVSEGADMAVVYYAGHGVELDGQNYLIPVDAAPRSRGDVLFDSIPLEFLTEAVSGASNLRMVLLDACRNNPFSALNTSSTRSLMAGLAPVEPAGGTIVAFSAKGGTIANDGGGRNSPFAAALLANIEEPGLEISFLFRRVREAVLESTEQRQEPFVYGSLPSREIYLVPQAGAPPVAVESAAEAAAWARVKDTEDEPAIEEFLLDYPRGRHVEDAVALIRGLRSAPHEATPKPEPPQPEGPTPAVIEAIQRELERGGCEPGPTDGTWGRRSQVALAAFGRRLGLDVGALPLGDGLLVLLKSSHGIICAPVTIDVMHVLGDTQAQLIADVAREYEALNPGVTINLKLVDMDRFKQNVVATLRSGDAPDVLYSWGGGVLSELADRDLVRPIDDAVSTQHLADLGTAGVAAFTRDGHLYGLPWNVSEVGLWYNKAIFERVGIDPEELKTWSGFLDAVRTLKDHGFVPVALGAGEPWTALFWYSELVIRQAGQAGFEAAERGVDDGFAAPAFVEAAQDFLDLAAMNPFQRSFATDTKNEATDAFADGRAAMLLMGDWEYAAFKDRFPDHDIIGLVPFPRLENQQGGPDDDLGGISGWIFSKDAPDEAVQFIQWLNGLDVQKRFAERGFQVPLVAGAAESLDNPFQKALLERFSEPHWHALFFDQELPQTLRAAMLEVAVKLAENTISAEDAVAEIEAANPAD